MRKTLTASFSFAYQLFRRLCDPAVEGTPYLAEEERNFTRKNAERSFAPRRRFGFKI